MRGKCWLYWDCKGQRGLSSPGFRGVWPIWWHYGHFSHHSALVIGQVVCLHWDSFSETIAYGVGELWCKGFEMASVASPLVNWSNFYSDWTKFLRQDVVSPSSQALYNSYARLSSIDSICLLCFDKNGYEYGLGLGVIAMMAALVDKTFCLHSLWCFLHKDKLWWPACVICAKVSVVDMVTRTPTFAWSLMDFGVFFWNNSAIRAWEFPLQRIVIFRSFPALQAWKKLSKGFSIFSPKSDVEFYWRERLASFMALYTTGPIPPCVLPAAAQRSSSSAFQRVLESTSTTFCLPASPF